MNVRASNFRRMDHSGFINQDYDDYDETNGKELSLKVVTSAYRQSYTSGTTSTSPTFNKKLNDGYVLHLQWFAIILEDVLLQLRILGECNNKLRNYNMQHDMNKLRCDKYGVDLQEVKELEADPKDLECDDHKLRKLAADRSIFITILTNTYMELAINKCFKPLTEYRESIENKLDYYLYLIDEESRNREIRHDWRRQVRQQRIRIKSTVYDNNLIIEKLTSKLQDAANYASVQDRYITKWESSRTEQNNMSIELKEGHTSSIITKYRNKADDEQRIHAELDHLIKIRTGETLREIDACIAKIDKDMEEMEFKIAVKRVNYEKTLKRRLEIEETLDKHGKEIESWLHFKKDQEELREYQQKMNSAATIVQAWWRGVLVRLELGPFKAALIKKKYRKKKKQI